LRGLALSALSIFCFAVLALGQDATVVGTVTDPTGSVLPKATIKITSINTGQVRTLTTNESGQYVAPDLAVGQYDVQAQAPGFKVASLKNVVLNVGDRRRLDFAMQVGNVQESVTVEANEVRVQTDSGEAFKLSELKGQRVVLYFYPKADTPGCTVEACEFRDLKGELAKKGTTVLGISPDKSAAQAKFKQKYDLPFTLLADEDKTAAEAYGVWKEKNMYGRKVMGIERTTFVIGPDGKIEKIYNKVKAEGHAAEVLSGL